MIPNRYSPGRSAGTGPALPKASPRPPVAADVERSWGDVRARLRAELGEQIFESWFERMEIEGVEAGTAQLSVPTRFLKSWIDQYYRDRLTETWRDAFESVTRVEVVVRSPNASPRPCAAAASAGSEAPAAEPSPKPARAAGGGGDDGLGSPLDRRLTFATFVVGRSNELAHASALKVASALDAVTFNPLYIHASVGLGKTHLLQAIVNAVRTGGRRALYLTAEKFMYGFASALKGGGAIAFKDHLRGIDLLAIDDVQFLQGKHMQAEFGHTLNALLDGSRQVVVAGDRPPADLETLDERMKSRLAGGLAAEIGPLDQDLRLRILRAKVEAARERHPGLALPESVVAYVAHAVQSNARDLDGALNRLAATAELHGRPMAVETAEQCLRDLVRAPEPRRVRIEDIQRICAKHYTISKQDLVSSRRTRNVVLPRQIAMYLAKALTPRSLPEIGRRFGGRDHTTVLHAVRKIETQIEADAALAQEIELLKRLLQEA
jgi:chromosomal replication initiator protein